MHEHYTEFGSPMNWDPLRIAIGQYPHVTVVHKFGRNTSISSNGEDIWGAGGVYDWPTSGATLEAISDSTEDSTAGIGARAIYIEGISTDYNALTATLALNGTTVTAATTDSFFRVNRAWVTDVGEYAGSTQGSNNGTITIRQSSTGPTQATINITGSAGYGQTEIARYTVPLGQTAFIKGLHVTVDSARNPARIHFFQRQDNDTVSAPFTGKRLIHTFDGVNTLEDFSPEAPLGPFPEKTDIWAFAVSSTGAAGDPAVDVDMMLYLIND